MRLEAIWTRQTVKLKELFFYFRYIEIRNFWFPEELKKYWIFLVYTDVKYFTSRQKNSRFPKQ